jgi:hypothetical protein
LLTEHYYGHNPQVDADVVTAWKEKLLRVYDDEMDDSPATRDYQVERREVIEDTFNKLEGQARH